MEFFHPATWHHVSGMTCRWICLNVRHIGILLPVSTSTISPQSTCHSAPVCKILSKSDRPRQKNDVMSIFKIVDCRGLIMGSLKSPCTTSYGLSIETIALNCLVFEKIAFFAFWQQTHAQTDKHNMFVVTCPLHEAALAVASGNLLPVFLDLAVYLVLCIALYHTLKLLLSK